MNAFWEKKIFVAFRNMKMGSNNIIIIIIINSLFKEGNSVSKEMLISPEAL